MKKRGRETRWNHEKGDKTAEKNNENGETDDEMSDETSECWGAIWYKDQQDKNRDRSDKSKQPRDDENKTSES